MLIRVGARRSPLARAQADSIADMLRAAGHDIEMVGITTEGDTDRRHLTEIGGTGVFAIAVRDRLRDKTIDVAVHSLKDLPTAEAPGLDIAAIPERAPVHDVVVGTPLAELAGKRVGTGSPRRAAQLREYSRSSGIDFEIVPIRGNVDTRLDLVAHGELDAVLLAAAGVHRLGYLHDGDRLTVRDLQAHALDLSVMLPAAGQGALGVEIRADDEALREAVLPIDDPTARATAVAERAFLNTLEAGCLAPVGVAARLESGHDKGHDLHMSAVIAVDSPAGESMVRVTGRGTATDASGAGQRLAEEALTEIGPVRQLHPKTPGL
ncbi:hydroxymethylbilane synthase [Enemella sp. A6]|uniref:hydroxymethylbilane synthase n=1 Tax=Enemella sp. A6 TaxID=3440152 RepID=UPI003EB7EB9F